MPTLEEKVKSIIIEQLGIMENDYHLTASFLDDLGAEDVEVVELIMAFEGAFEIEIPDQTPETLRTVGDAIQYLKRRMGQ
jgi:acyl carrier protein